MDSIKTFPKFTIFFVLLMGLEIAGLTVIPTFHMVSKAMIMAGLVGFYITVEKRQNNAFLLGLILALLGDCFFLYDTPDFFKIGLVAFIGMQLCYLTAFNRKRRIPKNADYLVSAGIGVVSLGTLLFLWKDLGDSRALVAAYSVIIATTAIYAYLRHPKLRGYTILLTGVVLLMISDSILAYDRFSSTIPYGQIIIMLTYMIAQYLIVTGEVLGNMPRAKAAIGTKTSNSAMGRHKAS